MTERSSIPDYDRFGHRHSARLRPLRHWVVYLLVRVLLAATGPLSIGMLQRIGRGLGSVMHLFSTKFRRLCLVQLEMAMPELSPRERKRIGRDVLRHQGMTLMETLALARFRREGGRWVRAEGEDALTGAHAEGRGVLLVTAHTGNWELLPIVLARHGIKALAMVTAMTNPHLRKLAESVRDFEHLEIAERGDPASPRQMLRALRRGDGLIMANDVDIDTHGVFVDFFGIAANTPRASASLALKLKAPLVTYFDRRLPDGTHCIRFERVPVTPEMLAAEDPVQALTQEVTRRMERHIREWPEQWVWNHRRWRRRPDSETAREA
ncbi:MAG: hypothetical protein IIC64_17055 [SAR324 cluster bacterium]|nr:hypothetical protein [SAR324 cluster bacterium]